VNARGSQNGPWSFDGHERHDDEVTDATTRHGGTNRKTRRRELWRARSWCSKKSIGSGAQPLRRRRAGLSLRRDLDLERLRGLEPERTGDLVLRKLSR